MTCRTSTALGEEIDGRALRYSSGNLPWQATQVGFLDHQQILVTGQVCIAASVAAKKDDLLRLDRLYGPANHDLHDVFAGRSHR